MVSLLKCNVAGFTALVSLISFSFASRLLFDRTSDDISANIGWNSIPLIPVQRSHWPDGSSSDSDDFSGGGLNEGWAPNYGRGGSLDGAGNFGGSYGDWVPKFGGGGSLDGAGRNGEFDSGSTEVAIDNIPSIGNEEAKRGSSRIRTLPVINQQLPIGDDTISGDREGKRRSSSQIRTLPVINQPLSISDDTVGGNSERKIGRSPYHTLPINDPLSIGDKTISGDIERKKGSLYHTLPINEPFSMGDETISGSIGGYKMKRDDPNENK